MHAMQESSADAQIVNSSNIQPSNILTNAFKHTHAGNFGASTGSVASVMKLIDTALLTVRHLGQDTGWLSNNLVLDWHQVWLVQSNLPGDARQLYGICLIYQGYSFGSVAKGALVKRIQLSESRFKQK